MLNVLVAIVFISAGQILSEVINLLVRENILALIRGFKLLTKIKPTVLIQIVTLLISSTS
jgi:hypothetical protein